MASTEIIFSEPQYKNLLTIVRLLVNSGPKSIEFLAKMAENTTLDPINYAQLVDVYSAVVSKASR